MRKFAGTFEPTKELAVKNKDYEHRRYEGFFLAKERYSNGWLVRKEISSREYAIKRFACIAAMGGISEELKTK